LTLKVHEPEFEPLEDDNFVRESITNEIANAIRDDEDIGREFLGNMVGTNTKSQC